MKTNPILMKGTKGSSIQANFGSPARFDSKVDKMKAEFEKLEAMKNRTAAQERKYISLGRKLDAAYGDDTRG
tara:strand:+ start:551 stop:766 length:216 start_codon:yes stop_codon:yes gene_type:complete